MLALADDEAFAAAMATNANRRQLTREDKKAMARALMARGVSRKATARAVGIPWGTFCLWFPRGEGASAGPLDLPREEEGGPNGPLDLPAVDPSPTPTQALAAAAVSAAAEVAAPEIAARKAEDQLSPKAGDNSRHPGGRPPKPEASRREQAQAIGVGEETLRRSEQHKPLTESERARRLVREAARVAPRLEQQRAAQRETSAPRAAQYPRGGQPRGFAPAVSRGQVADALGEPETTLRRAQQHVAAVETLGIPAALPLPSIPA